MARIAWSTKHTWGTDERPLCSKPGPKPQSYGQLSYIVEMLLPFGWGRARITEYLNANGYAIGESTVEQLIRQVRLQHREVLRAVGTVPGFTGAEF